MQGVAGGCGGGGSGGSGGSGCLNPELMLKHQWGEHVEGFEKYF